MSPFNQNYNLVADAKTFSQQAEANLIESLLELPMFSKIDVQRKLALYPYAATQDKNELICKLMNTLWPVDVSTNLFPSLNDFEIFLTGSGKRGHFIHQFEVFLLGMNLLITLMNRAKDIKSLFGTEETEWIYKTWLITSTAHDCGYPLQEAINIKTRLFTLYRNLDMQSMASKYEGIVMNQILAGESELWQLEVKKEGDTPVAPFFKVHDFIAAVVSESLNIDEKEAQKIQKNLIEENKHGYISAAILFRIVLKNILVKHAYEDVTKLSIYKSVRLATSAVVLHDLPEKSELIIEKINFSKNPFAYLLFLIDNIQEWSRNIIQTDKYPFYSLDRFEKSKDGNRIQLDYVLIHNDWPTRIINDTREYINKMKEKLQLLKGPIPNMGILLSLNFVSNDGKFSEGFNLNI